MSETILDCNMHQDASFGNVRRALKSDAREILEIYTPYVLDTAISFEATLPSLSEVERRIEEYSKLGWLVYEIQDALIGYAYASKHRDREAYQWCCEVSVYIHPQHHRKGIASILYTELFQKLRDQGYVNSYAGIELPNEASVKFHESMGFTPIGVFRETGFKLGKWHDVGWWHLKIAEPGSNPKAPSSGYEC